MGYSTGIFSNFGSFLKVTVTRKIEVGINSNLLHSISTSICIRKCNKIFWWFRGHFLEKSMGYSTGYFSKFWRFLKMAVTRKIEVGINSNLLHSISTSICIRKYNKNFWWFRSHFLEKSMGYSRGVSRNLRREVLRARKARRDFGHTLFCGGKTTFSFIFLIYGCGRNNFKHIAP